VLIPFRKKILAMIKGLERAKPPPIPLANFACGRRVLGHQAMMAFFSFPVGATNQNTLVKLELNLASIFFR